MFLLADLWVIDVWVLNCLVNLNESSISLICRAPWKQLNVVAPGWSDTDNNTRFEFLPVMWQAPSSILLPLSRSIR